MKSDDGEPTGAYALSKAGFGKYTQVSATSYEGNYMPLGYEGYQNGAILAFNYQGLGLPVYMWDQVVELLTQINSEIKKELTCAPDGYCSLAGKCESVTYSDLWTYSFQLAFSSNSQKYITVPLATFAVEAEQHKCTLLIQRLNDTA